MTQIFRSVVCVTALIVTALAATGSTFNTDSCDTRFVHHFGIDIRGAHVAGAREAVKDTYIGSRERPSAMAGNLSYSFSYPSASRQGRLYPGAYQGLGLGTVSFFDGNRTGHPVNVYLFQGAPIFSLAPGLTFDYEWNFGASFGWKKYDGFTQPLNLIVGSPVNAYINLGFMLGYRLSPDFRLTAGLDLTHYSNGNTEWPNPGVNTIGARLGLIYTIGGEKRVRTLADNSSAEPFRPHISYDLVAYGAVRKRMVDIDGPEKLPGHFGIAGINFAPMWNFNRFLRAGVSADIQYDESSNLKKYWVEDTYGDDIRFHRPPFSKQLSWGLSARGELVMPIFSINAGMGYNLVGNPDVKNFYQLLALKIHVMKSCYVHIGYQLNSFRNPNNLMIGLGYRFHDRR